MHYPLVYEGEVNQLIIKAFASNMEQDLIAAEESSKVIRRVYHVIVESLQNMSRHADSWHDGGKAEKSRGMIIFNKSDEGYTITTGNLINKAKVEDTLLRLDQVNALDKDGLKALYKERIRDGHISERGGAGLGFIDMVKKTGSPILHRVETANDVVDYLMLRITVSRD